MLETTVAAVSAGQVRVTCGQDPSWVCRSVLDWTDNRTLAEIADFIIGRPLKIIALRLQRPCTVGRSRSRETSR